MITGKWIWNGDVNAFDEYVQFTGNFNKNSNDKVLLRISADSILTVNVNDKLAFFTQCADYPEYKLYDVVDITDYVVNGDNKLDITVWHLGPDTSVYVYAPAGLIFDVVCGDKVLLKSDENVLSRRDINFKNGYKKIITGQMGYSFYYDNTVVNNLPFEKSTVIDKKANLVKRNLKPLKLAGRCPANVEKKEYGYLIDLGAERVGFVDLDIESSVEQLITISYAEHLVDGLVPRFIGPRDFSVEFYAKKGENKYMNTFRRLAGRYLEVKSDKPIKINYVGLNEVIYEIKEIKKTFSNPLDQKIYDVAVNTLKLCMHEHYEDCPWREQAMYVGDSRNQMLCGYYAFEGYEYQKENIKLITKGLRKDGLLSITFPTDLALPIPMFSLLFIKLVSEYAEHTKDFALINEIKDVLDKIMGGFDKLVEESGLIARLKYPCWNFYEWAPYSANDNEISRSADAPYVKHYDIIMNCLYVHAKRLYAKLFNIDIDLSKTEKAIVDTFYNKEKGLFKLSTDGENYSQLGNGVALLIGLGGKELADKIISDDSLIKITLSMNTFIYDALLNVDESYKDFIIEDIRKKYKYMLDQDATTFWETEIGWKDFGNAGSLCHGWSAMPVYYFNVLGLK